VTTIEDAELLRRYVVENSEAAFTELVNRHLGFVYASALRRVGNDAHLARDVAQQVFIALARHAGWLKREGALSGWLYTTTKNATAQAVRAERRRQGREQKAHIMNELTAADSDSATDWTKLAPVLDTALDGLGAEDRQAVLLRFFEGKSFREVGATLRLTENAARMRVERALDKLHGALAGRGVTSTTAALAAALAGPAVAAAPAGLAASVAGAVLGGGGAATGGGLIATFMSMTKLQVGIAAAVTAAGVAGFAVQHEANAALVREAAALRAESAEMAALQARNAELRRVAAEVVELKRDDAALARLRDEAAGLAEQLKKSAASAAKVATVGASGMGAAQPVFEAPRASAQVAPTYPSAARQAGIEGAVMVEFVVDTDGRVQQVRAVNSHLTGQQIGSLTVQTQNGGAAEPSKDVVMLSPVAANAEKAPHDLPAEGMDVQALAREFEKSAVEAVSKWRFAPASRNGRPVNTVMQTPVVFTISQEKGKLVAAPWF
jgi:RNA polymerase sigma factor (sigma-70 family)